VPAPKCVVPEWPAEPDWTQCAESPDFDACAITLVGVWVRAAIRYHDNAKGCPAIQEVPQPAKVE